MVQARSYFTGTALTAAPLSLMLSPLFNLFFDTSEVNEINLGNFRTNAMNMSLYPNTFLFNLNQANPNAPGSCCVLGFHTYFANFDGRSRSSASSASSQAGSRRGFLAPASRM